MVVCVIDQEKRKILIFFSVSHLFFLIHAALIADALTRSGGKLPVLTLNTRLG
jgi:hypothetical protein